MWALIWQCNPLVNAQSGKGELSSSFAVQSRKGNAGHGSDHVSLPGGQKESEDSLLPSVELLSLSWLSLHSVVISFKFWKPVLHGFKPLFGIYYSKRRSLFWREWVVSGNCKPVDVMMTFLMASLSGVLPMKCGGKTRWQRWGHVATLSWTKTPIAQLDKIFLYPFQI